MTQIKTNDITNILHKPYITKIDVARFDFSGVYKWIDESGNFFF